MSLTSRVLIGLVAGFLLGLALASASPSIAGPINAFLAPVGTIFVNLIRMTVIPLVASMLVASAGRFATAGASGALGRVGARAMAMAVALLTAATAVSVAIAVPVLDRVRIDAAAAMALRGPVTGASAASPTLAQWVTDLVPLNVIKAAADGTMLPVILFAVLFGLALARVAEPRRAAALGAIQGVADAMQRLVAWILNLAPIGVFALAVPLASKLGLGAAGAVLVYIVLVVSLTVAAAIVLLYPVGIVAGRMSPAAFIAFCTPAQAVAFASRSSLAALPAMIESAERARMAPLVSGFILPLAASIFRVGGAVAMTVGALFLARLYGVTLSPAQLATMGVTVVLSTFTVPGIPFGSIIAMVPVLISVGLPVEGIGILLAADTIPDMFRTTANATGMLTLAAALNRDNRLEPADATRRQ
jgi:Na+/H+-dicarboxylate symporter